MMSLVAKRFDDAKAGGRSTCSNPIATVSRMASSGATSSMSKTRSRRCAYMLETPGEERHLHVGTGKRAASRT